MTARHIIDAPAVKLAAYAVLLGMAWATLRAEVAQKADKTSVESMASDIRDIKSILCRNSTDSFCNHTTR